MTGLITDFYDAYQCASRQLVAMGKNAIGVRGTPVVSFWPMKEKWRKFGDWFTTVGFDGDVDAPEFWFYDLKENHDVRYRCVIEPLILQLYYKKLSDNQVVQLAWIRADWDWSTPREIRSDKIPHIALE